LTIERGQALSPEAVIDFVAHNGYVRAETVRESGEFAVRGGIIDLFPPGAAAPLRVDFFGDEIEEIRSFDPMSQRSAGRLDGFVLKPVARLPSIRPRSIASAPAIASASAPSARIRSTRRSAPRGSMPAWSIGCPCSSRRWRRCSTIWRHAVTIDHQGEEAASARFELIADFYRARTDLQRAEAASGAVYRPLPPELLYLVPDEWAGLVKGRPAAVLSPFGIPEGGRAVDGGGRPGRTFGPERAQPGTSLYDAVAEHIAAEQNAGRRVMLAAYSAGSLDRLSHVLADHGSPAVSRWPTGRPPLHCRRASSASAFSASTRASSPRACRHRRGRHPRRFAWRARPRLDADRTSSSPSWRISPPATTSSMSSMASAAMTGWRTLEVGGAA